MSSKIRILKLSILVLSFTVLTFFTLSDQRTATPTGARSNGSPAGRTSAPNEGNCTSCHSQNTPTGSAQIVLPASYRPGQTLPVSVVLTTTDMSRRAWGFQLTALDSANVKAGTLTATTGNTVIVSNSARQYMNQTNAGTFRNQTGGATWTFNWMPPATSVGPVTFYAAALLADNSDDEGGDQVVTTLSTIPAAPPAATRFDFDADGKADLSVFRPSNNCWYLLRGTAGYTWEEFGVAGDIPAPADFDGDRRTEIAVFRPSTGTWYWFNVVTRAYTIITWGENGDLPVPADHDGDGKADLVLYRPSTGIWYKRLSSSDGTYSGTFATFHFGTAEDKPQIGDFDGDGRADLSVFRPSNNSWYFYRTSAGFGSQIWGESGDIPAPADYNGDGVTDVAVFRPSSGEWYIVYSGSNQIYVRAWGVTGDQPVEADYDGDGKADLAVFRPSNNTWYILGSSVGFMQTPYGQPGDKPAATSFVF